MEIKMNPLYWLESFEKLDILFFQCKQMVKNISAKISQVHPLPLLLSPLNDGTCTFRMNLYVKHLQPGGSSCQLWFFSLLKNKLGSQLNIGARKAKQKCSIYASIDFLRYLIMRQ